MRGHIVFDCDGTLISSAKMIFDTVARTLSEHLGREVTSNEVAESFDADIGTLYANFGIHDQSEKEELMLKWTQIAEKEDHKYALFDGISELLKKLEDAGYGLYVWTARDRPSTLEALKDLGVMRYFIDVRAGTDGPVKPNPWGLQELVGHIDKKDVVVIGDSYTDAMGAKAMGQHFIGALWCHAANREALSEFGCEHLLTRPLECYELIEKLIGR